MKKILIILILILSLLISNIPELLAEVKPRLVILPFLSKKDSICPICQTVFQRGEILPGSQKKLSLLLYSKIETKKIFALYPFEKVEKSFSKWERKEFEKRPISYSIKFGQEINCDFILIGFLFRWEERIGSSLGVERPASVAFDLHLFRVKDVVEVWRGKMDETQRPLSENLLKIVSFLRRKAQWLNAEELASVGLDEVLETMPGPKELEEKEFEK